VALHGLLADAHAPGDLLVRQTVDDESSTHVTP
jgi:hypothetical protein